MTNYELSHPKAEGNAHRHFLETRRWVAITSLAAIAIASLACTQPNIDARPQPDQTDLVCNNDGTQARRAHGLNPQYSSPSPGGKPQAYQHYCTLPELEVTHASQQDSKGHYLPPATPLTQPEPSPS